MFKQLHSQRLVLIVCVFAIFYPRLIQAQGQVGTLKGVVKDLAGAPVSGAFVKMKNDERRLTFMVVTQPQGRYSANILPPGKYVVQAIGGDYQSQVSAPIDVSASKSGTVD